MKNYILIIVSFLFVFQEMNSQVGINTNSSVDPSAAFEIEANQAGILLPRMSTTDRNMITNAAKGLIVYNTITNTLEYNENTAAMPVWASINTNATVPSVISQSAKFSNTDITTDINPDPGIDIPLFSTEEWNDNTSLYSVANASTLAIGETARYKLNINISITSNSNTGRKAPQIYITVNDFQRGAFANTGYIREGNNHEESSLHLNEVFELNANDEIRVFILQEGNNNTAVLRSVGSSNFYIEKLN